MDKAGDSRVENTTMRMRSSIIKRGTKRNLTGKDLYIKNFFVIVTSAFVILAVFIYPDPFIRRPVIFGLFFSMLFISYNSPGLVKTDIVPGHDYLLALLSLSVSLYFIANHDRILTRLQFSDPIFSYDYFFGIVTVLLLLEGSRRVLGPWLPLICCLSIWYVFMGQHISGRFGHMGFSTAYVIDGLFLTLYGIWGSAFGTISNNVLPVLLFGALFVKSGASSFLFDFVAVFFGKTKGGIAKIAIITSALFGMVSGGIITNVATTGSITIPAMRKRGYNSAFAASVECCASIGGNFMPPIMGSVAFIMADNLGMSYRQVALSALIPALLYFAALFITIDIKSKRLNIEGMATTDLKPSFYSLAKNGILFVIPLI